MGTIFVGIAQTQVGESDKEVEVLRFGKEPGIDCVVLILYSYESNHLDAPIVPCVN